MKHRYIYLILSFIFINTSTFSQITITQSDFTSFYSIGNNYSSSADTSVQSVNIGQPGGGNTWDFSNFVPHFTYEIEYMLPSDTPYADSFMTANIAGYFTQSIDFGTSGSGTSETWSYYNSSDATTIGNASLTITNDINGTGRIETFTHHFPAFIEYDFPITFGKTWEKEDSSTTATFSDGVLNYKSVNKTSYQSNIDAWGTMKMPGGNVVNALRSREVQTSTSYFFGVPVGINVDVTYFFMSSTGESFSVSAEDENPSDSGTIEGLVGWSNDAVTDFEKLEELPTEFALEQNYPNPFNPTTTFEYSIVKPSFVSLQVYDVLGNEVVKLVNEEQSAGKYNYNFDASNLASGTYLLQLKAGNLTAVKKITVMK